ncbi:MAG: NADH:flavin oxidoreductase [Acidobacteriota bacterium]|nr:MAG: NADH:flavin oxidoreductase [Acidobacteriota bacterium]
MSRLRDPLVIGDVRLPNRIWFPPVARDLAETDGSVTDENVEAYRRVASGGVGTVVVEHCFVDPDGRFSPRQIGVDRDACVPGLKRLARVIRDNGAVPLLQVSHAGSKTLCARRLAPSATMLPGDTDPPEELRADEIPQIVSSFAHAVGRAREAGFSGVEIHGAHGFLLSEFFSPLTNHRVDGYGGGLRERARLALEVVEAARRSAREDFLIGFRLGADDDMDGGLTPVDAVHIAGWLQAAGVNIISVSGGLCGSAPRRWSERQGFFVAQAEMVKRSVTLPVVGVGGITDAAYARVIIERGRVDLVAVGRKLVEDPEWARRALEQ